MCGSALINSDLDLAQVDPAAPLADRIAHQLEYTAMRLQERQGMLGTLNPSPALKAMWKNDVQRFAGICSALQWVQKQMNKEDRPGPSGVPQ